MRLIKAYWPIFGLKVKTSFYNQLSANKMIRKVYLDFIKDKVAKKDLKWLIKRARQYFLIQISYRLRRPLCGPVLGTLFTTYKCNYRCKMCNLPLREEEFRKKGREELSTSHMKGLLEDFRALGTNGIGFTGGEPLLRKDIFELLAYAKELEMITHLNTNGFFLNEENAERILKAKVDSINISLDAARAKTHDSIRGCDGAFDRVISAVKILNVMRGKKKVSLRVKVVTVLDESNIDEVEDIIELAADLGVDCVEFIPQQPFFESWPAAAAGFDEEFFKKLSQTTKYLLGLKRKNISLENSPRHIKLFEKSFKNIKFPLKCFAGFNSYAVDCFGDIYPCMPWINWGRPAGNIKDMPFKRFWYSAAYNEIRAKISKCRGCYLNCQAELNMLFNIFSRQAG